MGLLMPLIAAQNATANDVAALDWVPVAEVPEELRDPLCRSCGGRYIDPLAGSDVSGSPESADIRARATQSELQGDDIYLRGGVTVEQGYRQLRGGDAYFNRDEGEGRLTGGITLREPGLLLRGEEARYSTETGEASIEQSEFVLHEQHLHGSAGQLRRNAEGLLFITDGSMSYCAPGSDEWAIRADSIKLDVDEGVGTARGAKLDLGGVPVLYLPWLRFPLDDRRRTGLLWPDLGSDSSGGLDVAVPIYFNLAPNYDLLYTPRYIQERGTNHELEARYLDQKTGSWTVGGAYMAQDDQFLRDRPQQEDQKRWLGVIKQNGLFDQRWRSRVDYSRASDVDYLKDLDTSNLDMRRRTNLLQLASMDYLGEEWLIGAEFQQFQSLADDISNDYKKLPQITASYRTANTPFEINPIFLGQYSYFDTDDDRVTGQRVYLEGGATAPMLWQYGFLRPTVKYRYLEYELNEQGLVAGNSPSTGSALASIDGGLVFERRTGLAGRGLLQTLEPRFYYLRSEYEDQSDQPDFDSAELTFSYNQLFRETRFSGRDRLDDSNQLSLGLTTRYISDEDGREYLNASLGQIFYFDDRRVRLNPQDPALDQSSSEMAAELNFYPNKRLSLRNSLVWDPDSGNMNAGSLQASYRRDDNAVFNLGYSYRRPLTQVNPEGVTEQAHASAHYPLNNRWKLFAAVNYSIEDATSVEDVVGIEYDTCCWRVRLLHLRYFDNAPGQNTDFSDPDLERKRSTQVQVVLKGMGGFGNRVSDLLEDMIRGFQDRDY
ncbi:LPS-assembly protein LptD [Kineobactrum sediminis]|uniref:LPS-assembly protein LptD n=2 Tax=Kineobactrum sediminis TaxID=1905677 RepID=A0A2N5XY71_9GAMM|nr:LPS-assembly protein LptD [Kineobactrum sediminis]